MEKIWFTSDLHFSHKNILKYSKGRELAFNIPSELNEYDKIKLHDERLIELWNKTIGKSDKVYILGDFAFADRESTKAILSKLKGSKFLILGNHDGSSENQSGFEQIVQYKEIIFKKENFDFLEEDFGIFCCHYAMLTWDRKQYGVCQVMGHSHGSMDEFNEESTDLRVDVGLDGKLANFNFVSLEQLYKYFKKKTKGKLLSEYAQEMKENKFI